MPNFGSDSDSLAKLDEEIEPRSIDYEANALISRPRVKYILFCLRYHYHVQCSLFKERLQNSRIS